jgi:serpin B
MRGYAGVFALVVSLGLAGLSGCGRGDGAGQNLSSEARSLVAGNNAFAFELFGRLKGTNQNLFLSPYSISECLAMSYAGARGNTEKQMRQVLHFEANSVHPAFGELQRQLKKATTRRGIELNLANGVWAKKNQPLLPAFTSILRQDYDAEARQVDFATQSGPVTKQINDWVSAMTKGKLGGVLPSGLLDQDSRLVLVSVIYFKGTWKTKFKPELTRQQDFQVDTNRWIKCPMMVSNGKFRSYRHDGPPPYFDMLELPYAGNDFSFVAILPGAFEWLDELESKVNDKTLTEWLNSLQEGDLAVVLPKFRLKTEFSLDRTLSAMGMSDSFGEAADFSGIDGTTLGYISLLRHGAFVEVDEEGTTAAAATVSHHGTKGMSPRFVANHPFLFLIRDNRSGSILFLGRLMDPTAG